MRRNRKGQFVRESASDKISKIARAAALATIRREQPLAEFKYVDTSLGSLTENNKILLNAATRGTDVSNRVGREITMTSVQISTQIRAVFASAVGSTVRLMLVYDRFPQGAAFTHGELIEGAETFGLRVPEYRKRFKIIKDVWVDLNPDGASTMVHKVNFYMPLKLKTVYNSLNAGDITDIENGALYLYCPSVPDATVTFATYGQSRVRFTDT